MKSFTNFSSHQAALQSVFTDMDDSNDDLTSPRPQEVDLLPASDLYIMKQDFRNEEKNTRKSSSLDMRVRRLRANDRERRRIQSINGAMEALRKVIPDTRNNRKVTKLQLLKLAQDYIRYLSEVLQTSGAEDCSSMQTTAYRISSVSEVGLDSFDFHPTTCDSFVGNYC